MEIDDNKKNLIFNIAYAVKSSYTYGLMVHASQARSVWKFEHSLVFISDILPEFSLPVSYTSTFDVNGRGCST